MTLNDLGLEVHATAVEKGFWPESIGREPDTYVAKLMMVTTEIAEIVEAYRKQQGHAQISDEFADVVIRLVDLYAAFQEDGIVLSTLDEAIEAKTEVNKSRPHKHGNLI